MPKKKFLVYCSAWNAQILVNFIKGMQRAFAKKDADIYVLTAYPTGKDFLDIFTSEYNIFNLADPSDFDGAVVFSSSVSYPEITDKVFERCLKAGIPTIARGPVYEGTYNAGINNHIGMRELCEHLIKEHGVKRPAFIGGQKESEDSYIRLEVLKEVLKENNLKLDDNLIVYTDWDNFRAIEFVEMIKKSNIKFPDAIICANDGLAMSVCLTLSNLGFDVPRDVIVTGFDYLDDSQRFYPSISSVDQCDNELGYESGLLLWNLANKKKSRKNLEVMSKFVPGESCGCYNARKSNVIRNMAGREYFSQKMSDNAFDRELNRVEYIINQSKTYPEMQSKLSEFIESEHSVMGKTVHILLDEAFFDVRTQKTKKVNKYSEKMHVLFSMTDERVNREAIIEAKNIFPNSDKVEGNRVYMLLPFYDGYQATGYMVIADALQMMATKNLQKFQNRLGVSLLKFRQNNLLHKENGELIEMIRKDSLTHVKNRAAFDDISIQIQKKIEKGTAKAFAIAMFDINNLKVINDTLGHEAGDAYIIASSRLICATFSHSPVFRIGGDEFLVLLTDNDYEIRYQLQYEMKNVMNSLAFSKTIPETERVSIASGISEYNETKDKNIQDVFRRADTLMYEDKKIMKADFN